MSKKTILKRFGDLEVGDVVRAPNGKETELTQAYDEHTPETMYEVETGSGDTVLASGNHLWYVETSLDLSLHHDRRKNGKKFFGNLSEEVIAELLKVAEYESDEEIETSLIDIITLLGVTGDREATSTIVRVAESIGPIAENNTKNVDLYLDEEIFTTTVRGYDAKRFTQQILSLTGKRAYKKRWPLLVGRVVTTEQMVELSKHFDVNLPKP